MKMIDVTQKNYDEVINKNEGILILDFCATWCVPCKTVDYLLKEICENKDITIAKINIENELDIAVKFGITSVPSIIIMKNNTPIEKIAGLKEKLYLEKVINNLYLS